MPKILLLVNHFLAWLNLVSVWHIVKTKRKATNSQNHFAVIIQDSTILQLVNGLLIALWRMPQKSNNLMTCWMRILENTSLTKLFCSVWTTLLHLVLRIWVNLLIGKILPHYGKTATTAMLKLPNMCILMSQIHTGQGCKAENLASSFATTIWKNTMQLAAAKLGYISTKQARLRLTALFIFRMDSSWCLLKKQAPTSFSTVVSSSKKKFWTK